MSIQVTQLFILFVNVHTLTVRAAGSFPVLPPDTLHWLKQTFAVAINTDHCTSIGHTLMQSRYNTHQHRHSPDQFDGT